MDQPPADISPAPAGRLADRVRTHLESLLSSGELRPGDRINEAALAERLGVSRAPVREALRAMEGRGLVVQIANRGMFVRELSVKEMLDIFDLRALLMGYGAQSAAEFMTPERKAQLGALLDEMDAATRAQDGARYYRVNQQFHTAILSYANNGRAVQIYGELATDLHRFRQRYFDYVGNMVKSNAEHRAVYDAIVAGDAVRARQLAEDHVLKGKLRVLRGLDVPSAGAAA